MPADQTDQSDGPSPRPRVVLLGKPGCHLCDQARDVVRRVCGEFGEPWAEQSILDDPRLADEFWELIPVVIVDGAVHDTWRVDEQRLRAALSSGSGRH